jgi:peptidyl-prolyl cis-trans isomerase SurA
MLRFNAFLAGMALACLVFVSCKRSVSPNVAATVNSHSITYAELDKNFQSSFPSAGEHPSDDQSMFQKVELLRTMIDQEIMVQRAEKASLVATDADIEAKLNELKSPYTQEEFQRQLQSRKMTVEDLKAQLRRDLSVQKLFNKEITSHINITDKDISDFYNANRPSFNLMEPQIHMAQILVTPAANPEVRNLKNDKAQNDEQAVKKIQNLLARIRQGEDFAQLAQNYSEDPASAQNGGDLGFISESALDRASPELRKTVLSVTPGQVSNILKTQEGYRILKVIAKEPAGQRELNDPRVQQTIRETLQNRKDQLLRSAYVEVARNEAKVANHLALMVTQNKDNK